MKLLSTKTFFSIALVLLTILLNGCSTLKSEDFVPSDVKLEKKLPVLEPLVDIYSFEKNLIGKSNSNPDAYCSARQNFKNLFTDDATAVYLKDNCWNMTDTTAISKGSMVIHLSSYSITQDSELGYILLGLGTLFLAPIYGAPAYSFTTRMTVDLDVLDMKDQIIYSCKGAGEYSVNGNGLWYDPNYRKANLYATREALDSVKSKLSHDYEEINIALDKGVEEIHADRDSAIVQTAYEPEQLIRANTEFNNQNYRASIFIYDSVLQAYPYHIDALISQGKALAYNGQNTAAIKNFSRVIQLDPKNDIAYFERGNSQIEMKNYYAAIYDLTKTLALVPDLEQAYLLRADAEDELALNSDAIKDYQHLLKINPDLTFAKDRISNLQNRIQLEVTEQLRQQQIAEQERQQRWQQLNDALNTINSSISSIQANNTSYNNNSSGSQASSSPSTPATKNRGHIERITCSYCKGSKYDPAPTYGPSFGLERSSNETCNICFKPKDHYHKKCPSCNGRGYNNKFVAH